MTETFSIELSAGFESVPMIAVGDSARLHLRISNMGDDFDREIEVRARTSASLLLVSTSPCSSGLRAGSELGFTVPALLAGESRQIAIDVFALASAETSIAVVLSSGALRREVDVRCATLGRAAFAPEVNRLDGFPLEVDAGDIAVGRAIVTNTGTTPAGAELRVETDLSQLVIGGPSTFTLAPGERRVVAVSGRVPPECADGSALNVRAMLIHADGEVELGAAKILVRRRARVEASAASALAAVASGARIDWDVDVTNTGGSAAASFSVAFEICGGSYVAGTTRIGTARLLDIRGTSPLWSDSGLRIEGLRPAEQISLTCATVAEPGVATTSLSVRVRCDGVESVFASTPVAVEAAAAAPETPFVVRDVALAGGNEPRARYRRSQCAAIDPPTAGHFAMLTGLVRHLWALSVLCADAGDRPDESAQLAALRVTLRSVFDRLSIKVRMPYYQIRDDDILDPPAREALRRFDPDAQGSTAHCLARAARLIAGMQGDDDAIVAYRDAIAGRLAVLRDDGELIDALLVADAALDDLLAEVVAAECCLRTA